ncbi:uncharacterized protein C7orf50 homolog isoform X1 [Rhinatrema bivittatum]|uniref:uncharacterized protein C7orf50 homolog isoform X1 n=1 Tax=Rhinatrema bivittatum TaxID=194408 RepID=UPI00112B16F1|nr:uncharacterized protein C7orf50 homolog isoform X1 [Rhinatrema bivittatum]
MNHNFVHVYILLPLSFTSPLPSICLPLWYSPFCIVKNSPSLTGACTCPLPCYASSGAYWKGTATEAKGETVQHPGGEDLSPEERRVLERKLKKERKKEAKKLMREAGVGGKKEDPKKPSGSELALQYLLSWSERPKHWKFQKTRQTWLLLHMYDREKVPDKYFSILLEYLEGLQGGARELTVQKAEAIMKKDEDGADSEDGALLEKLERARKILQLLS